MLPHACHVGEVLYTGMLLGALLEPNSRDAVATAICTDGAARTGPRLTDAYAPRQMVDLVMSLSDSTGSATIVIVEHKRFDSKSHAPGYRKDPNAQWQSDQAYLAAHGDPPPSWLYWPGLPTRFVLLDGYNRSMDTAFKNGQYNAAWSVVGYESFADSLRESHDLGVQGLIPLLVALYAYDF